MKNDTERILDAAKFMEEKVGGTYHVQPNEYIINRVQSMPKEEFEATYEKV